MSVEVSEQKSIEKVVTGMPTSDGAGVSLTRIIGQPELPRLDPFLMLDFLVQIIQVNTLLVFHHILTVVFRQLLICLQEKCAIKTL